jgi:hypothetical protein
MIFTLDAVIIASAGYFKLLRELPLLYAGRITLAPLPGSLGRVATNPAPNRANPASTAGTEIINQSGPTV